MAKGREGWNLFHSRAMLSGGGGAVKTAKREGNDGYAT